MNNTGQAAETAPCAARLQWGEKAFLLCAGQTLKLGRAAENDIIIDDPKVSRIHAVIDWNGSGFTLHDLGSQHGTYVNHTRVSAGTWLLRDGDVLRLGEVALRYEIMRVPLAAPPEPNRLVISEKRRTGPCLRVILGPDMGQEYPLWGERITIGRASREATWEIRLTDRSVSRPHARLERRADGLYLVDLDSANGTQLNGAMLDSAVRLAEGDVIGVGETQMVITLG